MAGNGVLRDLRLLTPAQRNAVLASFLGWTLDAFDFFILVFVLPNIAHDFNVGLKDAAYCITLTLALRPVGALVFGLLADRFGRKPILMLVILLYSGFEASCAFAPNLTTLLVLRAGFGFAMGGEWGIGASLAMETIPERTRGIVSGFLQEGYATGYLLAAILFWVAFPHIGWRGMFLVGALPAVLAIYMFFTVEESPAFQASRHSFGDMVGAIGRNWKMFLYIVLVMTCFNAFSHGTQDLYPTFLGKGLGFPSNVVAKLAIIANIGAIVGGILFGAYSERIGRRRAIVFAALLCLPVIPLWALSHSFAMLAAGAFLMQFCVQGAWGVIPAHLNEMSPPEVRGTFPGFTYQLGNFLVSKAAPLQVALATYWSGDYGMTLAVSAAGVAVTIAVVVGLGRERKGTALTG